MVWSSVRMCAVLELLVVVFQVAGVTSLCLSRLSGPGRWADRGRIGFVLALVGLGLAGTFCGRYDSVFALFAGTTLTLLLIGMTLGSSRDDTSGTTYRLGVAEPKLAG